MKNLVFLCIGTTKIIGDSIGPKVGDRLREKGVNAYVYGNTQRQVTAINVDDYAKMISQRHKDDIVVVIDSALGKLKDIGAIKVTRNGIKPGGAFDKNKERVGDIGILAVVGDADGNRMQELKDRDETFVGHLVDKVVEFVGGLLVGAIISAIMLAIYTGNAGGAWDNAKKYIESGGVEGVKKGEEGYDAVHDAAVVGDTVGDPLKDTVGPSLDILIKIMSTISLVMVVVFNKYNLFDAIGVII